MQSRSLPHLRRQNAKLAVLKTSRT
jgi:hypothetical protein